MKYKNKKFGYTDERITLFIVFGLLGFIIFKYFFKG